MPLNITLEYLQQEGLLRTHLVIPLRKNKERGLHIGVYDKSFFTDINEFAEMLTRIASITQDWYASGNLEEAFQWYQEEDYHNRIAVPIKTANRYLGSLRDWIAENEVDVVAEFVPSDLKGDFYFDGSREDFQIVIQNEQHFIDVFLADRT